jgi:uroporphyrinogen decarboxylase
MTSRERVLTTLDHKEPDKIPIDLGGTLVTGISIKSYTKLMDRLGFNGKREDRIFDKIQQLALIDERLLDRLEVDFRTVYAKSPPGFQQKEWEDENNFYFQHEYDITLTMPKDGYYYDFTGFPLDPFNEKTYNNYKLPNHLDPARIEGIGEEVEEIVNNKMKCCIYGSIACSLGLLQQLSFTMGFANSMINLKLERKLTERYLDDITRKDIEFWDVFLNGEGKYVDIIGYYDDFAGQNGLLISMQDFRDIFKPRYRQIFEFIHKKNPKVKIFNHSCGASASLFPEYIDIGVDIVNPIQVSAKDMDIRKLKKDFGNDLVFWGGLDTQHILNRGTVREVEDAVKKLVDVLAPGGGYIFNTVHNIQAGVPVENIITAFDTIIQIRDY